MLENNSELQEQLAILNSGTQNISPEMLIMAQDYLLSGNSSSSGVDIVS